MTIFKTWIIIFYFSSFGFSQDKNPFEIEHRIISEDTTHTFISENPFEIKTSIKSFEKLESNQRQEISPTLAGSQKNNIPLIVLLSSMILLAIAVQSSRKIIPNLYAALINENQSRILQRELLKPSLFSALLYAIFISNLSVLICYFADFQLGVPIWGSFVWLLSAILIIYLCRHFSMSLIANIFPFKTEIKFYDFTITHTHLALSIILLVINILITYSNSGKLFLWIGIGLWAIFIIYRSLRGALVGLRYRHINLFHFFVYICAFELAPNFSLFHLAKTSFWGS